VAIAILLAALTLMLKQIAELKNEETIFGQVFTILLGTFLLLPFLIYFYLFIINAKKIIDKLITIENQNIIEFKSQIVILENFFFICIFLFATFTFFSTLLLRYSFNSIKQNDDSEEENL